MKETACLLQAALVAAWWVGLAASQSFFSAFQFDGIPPTALWSFFAPDVVVLASLSTLRAYRRIAAIEYVILGAFSYAALYCCNATLLTWSGLLPTGLMLMGLARMRPRRIVPTVPRRQLRHGRFSAGRLCHRSRIWLAAAWLVSVPRCDRSSAFPGSAPCPIAPAEPGVFMGNAFRTAVW